MYTIRIGNKFGIGQSAWEAMLNAFSGNVTLASNVTERTTQGEYFPTSFGFGGEQSSIFASNGEPIGYIERH